MGRRHGGGGGAEGQLAGREGGGGGWRGLDERGGVAKGVESPLLGEQLLVGHRVDVGGEAEGRAAGEGGETHSFKTRWQTQNTHRRRNVRLAQSSGPTLILGEKHLPPHTQQ